MEVAGRLCTVGYTNLNSLILEGGLIWEIDEVVVWKHKLETLVRREFRCHEGSCGYRKGMD